MGCALFIMGAAAGLLPAAIHSALCSCLSSNLADALQAPAAMQVLASRASLIQYIIVEPSTGLEISSVSATYLSGCCCRVSATGDMVSLPTAPAAYLH